MLTVMFSENFTVLCFRLAEKNDFGLITLIYLCSRLKTFFTKTLALWAILPIMFTLYLA